MVALALPRRRAIAYGAILVVGVLLAGGAIFVLSGIYNVAASAAHFYITDRIIKLTLWRSIDMHSNGVDDAPDLDRPELVRLGALHFANGCQACHAGPGVRQSPIAEGMYPAAPLLSQRAAEWNDEELFWIVRHGLKFTGMPQWTGEGRDDEVWPVVAFLRALPGMSPQDYAGLTGIVPAPGFALPTSPQSLIETCVSCHGDASRPPVSGMVPSLNGQSEAYLVRALEEYALDLRQSGMMEPLAAGLSRVAIAELAATFSTYPPVTRPPEGGTGGDLEEGERIARQGLPQQRLPACLSCHNAQSSPQFPVIAGLPEHYIRTQLTLYRDGVRGASPYGAIMRRMAERLTEDQVAGVAAYIARLEPEASGRPVAAQGGGR